jgi:hypothetical protein
MWYSVKRALLLATPVAVLLCSTAHADMMNVSVAEDTYVANSTAANTNYGASYQLSSYSTYSGFLYQNITYLKFDLSSIPINNGITAVTLNLAGMGGSGALPVTPTNVYYVADDTWRESTMTWNTKKATFQQLGTITTTTYKGSVSNPFWYQWNLAVTPEMLADGMLSLAVQETGSPEGHIYASKDFDTFAFGYPGLDPYLGVTYTPVPEPSTMLLLGGGLAGLAFWRRRMRK